MAPDHEDMFLCLLEANRIAHVEQHKALKLKVPLHLDLHPFNLHPPEHCHHEYFSKEEVWIH